MVLSTAVSDYATNLCRIHFDTCTFRSRTRRNSVSILFFGSKHTRLERIFRLDFCSNCYLCCHWLHFLSIRQYKEDKGVFKQKTTQLSQHSVFSFLNIKRVESKFLIELLFYNLFKRI